MAWLRCRTLLLVIFLDRLQRIKWYSHHRDRTNTDIHSNPAHIESRTLNGIGFYGERISSGHPAVFAGGDIGHRFVPVTFHQAGSPSGP